jgi:hypothetical protein
VYELIGMRREALKWYNVLITQNVQSDSEILAKMGYLYQQEQDEFQAVHFYQESFRYTHPRLTSSPVSVCTTPSRIASKRPSPTSRGHPKSSQRK